MNMPTEFEMNHMNYDGNRKCTVYVMTVAVQASSFKQDGHITVL